MNKSELATALAKSTGLSKPAAAVAVDTVLAHIAVGLAAGEPVSLHGFGTFEARSRAPRAGVGPSGQPYTAPAKRTVHFAPAKALVAVLPAAAADA